MKNRIMRKIISVMSGLAIAAAMLPAVGASAKQAVTLPLPADGSYSVSVLGTYSGGGTHSSYIAEYVLGQSGSSLPYSVADIAASRGTTVLAVADGVIYQNNAHKNGGYNVVIKHDDGTYSYYGHLLYRSSLKKGTRVSCGDVIGYVGKTGSASGYHLHFEWSGHDPYCEFVDMGYDIHIMNNSGASRYPHQHGDPYTARVSGTDGSLAINSRMSAGYQTGLIPEGATCTVIPEKSSAKWYYVEYNGVSGYSYHKYLVKTEEPVTPSEPEPVAPPVSRCYNAYPIGTDGSLVINSTPSVGYGIGTIPEGACCTVDPDKSTDKWLYVTYGGVQGYSYAKYLTTSAPAVYTGRVSGTDGSLAINSTASSKYRIGIIPEGAAVTIFDGKRVGKWVWASYNGIYGYVYSKYIV